MISALRRATVLVLLFLPVAACGHNAAGPSKTLGPAGVVHGHVIGIGGPPPGTAMSLPATVAAFQSDKEVSRQAVAQGAEFSFTLPAGSYQLKVTDENNTCQPVSVQVAAGSNQSTDITCQMK